MTRKLRTPKVQIDALPSAAWTYALLAGGDPGQRLPDWITQMHGECGLYGAPSPAAVWKQHEAALLTEAKTNDFEPFFLTHRRPKSLGYLRWREAFLAKHKY